MRRLWWLGLLAGVLIGCHSRPEETVLAEFATSLSGRTRGQRHNALLSARRVSGTVLPSNTTWSFNQCVGQWIRGEGYVRAPVSYGGILVPAWGGGVCQTSTAVYNAALLAGLEVVERHPHVIAPRYVAPGLDAAVAQGIADLKVRNPYPFPVRLELSEERSQLRCRVVALAPETVVRQVVPECSLEREVRATMAPLQVVGFRAQPGQKGMLVRLWRVKRLHGETVRELCHETYYPPIPEGR